VADWLAAELGHAEILKRSTRVVLRRINRAEYNNTIRDLVGVDFNPAEKFPEDPAGGGFDNIGQALSMSPMQVELYYAAARQILDRALVRARSRRAVKWRFEPEEDEEGRRPDAGEAREQNVLLNKGENRVEMASTLVHHEAWNTGNHSARIQGAVEGTYIVRFRAAGGADGRSRGIRACDARRRARKETRRAEKRRRTDARRAARRMKHSKPSHLRLRGRPG
jgi:hypothetical protein